MAVVLDDDFGVAGLDVLDQLAQRLGAPDACHILQCYFLGTGSNECLGQFGIVLHSVHGRMGDAERGLRYHACLEGIPDGGDDVARVVESAEDAGDIGTLCLLYLIHKAAYVGRDGKHAQAVECAVEHVGLYAGLIKGLGKGAHRRVGVLAIEQVHLFEGSAVGLHTGKATHLYDDGGYAGKLVGTRLVLA